MFFTLSSTIFGFVSEDPLVFMQGKSYIKIRSLEILSFAIIAVVSGFFNGIGLTKIHMYTMLIVNLINIFLNYIWFCL